MPDDDEEEMRPVRTCSISNTMAMAMAISSEKNVR
jgi:hypothetical protein